MELHWSWCFWSAMCSHRRNYRSCPAAFGFYIFLIAISMQWEFLEGSNGRHLTWRQDIVFHSLFALSLVQMQVQIWTDLVIGRRDPAPSAKLALWGISGAANMPCWWKGIASPKFNQYLEASTCSDVCKVGWPHIWVIVAVQVLIPNWSCESVDSGSHMYTIVHLPGLPWTRHSKPQKDMKEQHVASTNPWEKLSFSNFSNLSRPWRWSLPRHWEAIAFPIAWWPHY